MSGGRRHAARAAAAAAVAVAVAVAAPSPARAGPPSAAVLDLAATSLAWSTGAARGDGGGPALALALRLPWDDAVADAGAFERLPGWVRRWIARWDPWDGSGYRLHPCGGLSLIGAWERPSGPEPLAIEPEGDPDAAGPRMVGGGAHTTLAVVDLSDLPRVLVALGSGGGRSHLHAYLGWQVTLAMSRSR